MTSLKGRAVALSVSDAPDRSRLGLPVREVDRALFHLCTALVRAGTKIVYAGNLDPKGFTFSMFRHLAGAYAGAQEMPFIHIVPEPILRGASFEDLVFTLQEGAAVVKTQIHWEGSLLSIRAVENGLSIGKGKSRIRINNEDQFKKWIDAERAGDSILAYSAAREAMTKISHARIVLGGKMGLIDVPHDAYQGKMPGIIEEAIFAMEAGMPCVPLGAFGGAARDVAISLGLLDTSKRVPRGVQLPTYASSLELIAGFRDKIPPNLRHALKALADDDRGEPMAYDVVKMLDLWLDHNAD